VSLDPFAIDAVLAMHADADPRAPGGEVTVALCGHWEHDGPCRWPHNSRLDTDTGAEAAHLRAVVVAADDEHEEIGRKVEAALRADSRWIVLQFATGAIADGERDLAARLAQA
jgi:hypothetical protein